MTSDLPAGFPRETIPTVLNFSDHVLSYSAVDGSTSMWKATVSVEGGPPVEIIVDNGINDIYVQLLVRIDAQSIGIALDAVTPYAVVGVAAVAQGVYLRCAFFIGSSTIHALTNGLTAITLAFNAFRVAGGLAG